MTHPPAKLAATVVLVRESPQGMEVFMVVRHHQIDFASGALVFPGGKLAAGDADPRAHARCSGIDGMNADLVSLRVGAIREAFEECGLLLARPAGQSALVGAGRLATLDRYRRPLDKGEIGIGEMLEAENLVLACEALVPFAHWITPTFMHKRFDTHFYLAVAPSEQVAVHDGTEAVDSVWMRPADLVNEVETGRRVMVPATLVNVKKLGGSAHVDDALAAAKAGAIVTVQPELVSEGEMLRLRIPIEAGYGITEFEMPAEMRKPVAKP